MSMRIVKPSSSSEKQTHTTMDTSRIKQIFQRRYLVETGQQIRLPQPSWAHGKSTGA